MAEGQGRRQVSAPEVAYVGAVDAEPDQVPVSFVRMEFVQGMLAYLFAILLLIIILWSFLNTGSREEQVWQRTTELLDVLLPVITSLLGSAVGFYFGTQRI